MVGHLVLDVWNHEVMLLLQPDFIQHMGEQDPTTGEWILSSQRQSIITSLLSAGTFFGALLQSML